MTIRFTEGEEEPNDALTLAENLFHRALKELNAALDAAQAQQFDQVKTAKTAVRDLVDFSKAVLEGKKDVEKLRRQVAGAVGACGELDLDAARDEVRRRLACLRDARGD